MTENALKIPPVTVSIGLPFQAMLRLEDTADTALSDLVIGVIAALPVWGA